jgi:hypothetical protein
MGLDMYAYLTTLPLPAPVDFSPSDDGKAVEFHYWRKHPNLHGWMHELYRSKGGANPDFNMSPVQLTADDLDALEAAVQAERLPETVGFFFGQSDGGELGEDLKFVERARAALKAGYSVFYFAWW